MSINNNTLTNSDRFRLLAMIKLGEWFDSRDAAFRLAVKTLWMTHSKYVDDELSAEEAITEMSQAIALLDQIDDDFIEKQREICLKSNDDTGYTGEIYLTRRAACAAHRKVTILPAIKETKKLAPVKDEA